MGWRASFPRIRVGGTAGRLLRLRKNRTRSYMNGRTTTANVRKRRTLFLRKLRTSYGILTDERNSYVLLKRSTEIRLWMNGKVTLETRCNLLLVEVAAMLCCRECKRRSGVALIDCWFLRATLRYKHPSDVLHRQSAVDGVKKIPDWIILGFSGPPRSSLWWSSKPYFGEYASLF